LYFVNENKNYAPLPRLPKYKAKKIERNAKKPPWTQNYLCKKCGRQFIGGYALRYKGYHSSPAQKIVLPPVCGIGIKGYR
jgi:transposase-like protein